MAKIHPIEERYFFKSNTIIALSYKYLVLAIGNKMMDLPCKHYFHEECLMPWLNQHDSCPICRFELKTDDPDYEKMKLQRSQNSINANQNNEQRTVTSSAI